MKRPNPLLVIIFIVMFLSFPATAYAGELGANESEEQDMEANAGFPKERDDVDHLGHDGGPHGDGNTPIEETDDPEARDEGRPFTPDGQATVVDLSYEGDGKAFYTFKTPAGNVFYLVIDRERNSDNVYFLNAVTEESLLALAEASDNVGSPGMSAIPAHPPMETETSDHEDEETEATRPNDEPAQPQPKENKGLIAFAVLGIVAAVGAGYYVKVVRPKQQGDGYEEEDEGEEMEFEDEPDESDEADEEDGDED